MKDAKIEKSSTVMCREDIYLTALDEDKVMMDLKTGSYYILNPVGSAILESIKVPKKVPELVQELTTEYEIKEEECLGQVMAFLEQLHHLNLIEIK